MPTQTRSVDAARKVNVFRLYFSRDLEGGPEDALGPPHSCRLRPGYRAPSRSIWKKVSLVLDQVSTSNRFHSKCTRLSDAANFKFVLRRNRWTIDFQITLPTMSVPSFCVYCAKIECNVSKLKFTLASICMRSLLNFNDGV